MGNQLVKIDGLRIITVIISQLQLFRPRGAMGCRWHCISICSLLEKHLILYAPFGYKIPEQRLGGAESGCRRTLAIYQKAGLKVHGIDKPAISRGKVVYALGMAMVPVRLLWLMLRYRKAAVHIVGFYCRIARYELMLLRLVHLMGHKAIYEMRNGNVAQSFFEGSEAYRNTLRKLCTEPEVVFGQGLEVVRFAEQQFNARINCYPNFVSDSYVADKIPLRGETVRIIFFGRIAPPKNIHLMIDTLDELVNNGMDANLELIGSYKEDYKSYLLQKIESAGLQGRVTFFGRQNLDFIVDRLKSAHYFLFPTVNKGEGHSNSLTEAMACGVVPIVSNVGFNASVCGYPELVVEEITAQQFARKIMDVEQSGRWAEYAEGVIRRVRENYTESIVSKMLMEEIIKML